MYTAEGVCAVCTAAACMCFTHVTKVELPDECMAEVDVLHEQFRHPCSHYHSKQACHHRCISRDLDASPVTWMRLP